MEPFKDDKELAATLRALRPEARREFRAELDERAAAGFPRRSPGVRPAIGRRLAARIRSIQPRRALLPAGATALAAVAAITLAVAVNEQSGKSTSSEAVRGQAAAIEDSFAPPAAAGRDKPQLRALAPLSGSARHYDGSEGYNASFKPLRRDIERSAEIVLGTNPADVGKDASRVFEAVHANRGIVLRSSVRDGAEGEAGARFELLIPSARLGDALAAFSAIAEVRSRHEATADITAPTVRTSEHLRDSRARIDGLLAQLAAADGDEERGKVEVELRAERRHAAALRSQAAELSRRANLSRVMLRIETGADAGSSGDSGRLGNRRRARQRRPHSCDRRRRDDRRPGDPRPAGTDRPARLARQPHSYPPRPRARPRMRRV